MEYDLLIINADISENLIHTALKVRRAGIADRLIILINTFGGDPFVAYRTMQHFGALYKTIEVVIPDRAMSAGTLLCMGADKIYMFEGSTLGPLDLQVSHPGDGGMISTLDIRQSTYNIFGLIQTIAKQLYDQAIGDMELGKSLAAQVAHNAAVESLKPMMEKIDPYHLHESYRATQVGRKYAGILLVSRMMKGKDQVAFETARILAEDYQTHSYSITMDEAQVYLKLNVSNITELDVLPHIQSFIDAMPEGIFFSPIRNMAPTGASKPSKGEKDES